MKFSLFNYTGKELNVTNVYLSKPLLFQTFQKQINTSRNWGHFIPFPKFVCNVCLLQKTEKCASLLVKLSQTMPSHLPGLRQSHCLLRATPS